MGLLAVAAFAQDAATTLEQARDKVLAATSDLPKYICVETIDRSYFSRKNPPETPPSCERIALDRKRGRGDLQLDKTDRLRVAVTIAQGREIYSWTGIAPYQHGVEDILNGGPIGTGPFAAFLLGTLTNSATRFHLLSEPSDTLDYGFRVPVEASRYSVLGGGKWLPTGYTGSLHIDRDSLDVRRLSVETGELPEQTGMCEENTVLEFRGADRALPAESRVRLVMRDTTETERVTTISDCREASATPIPAPVRQGAPVPKGMSIVLQFDADIDSEIAAAGDAISATVALPVITYGRTIDAGAKVTGRIVHMERRREPARGFLSIAFDTLEQKGVLSPFYAKLADACAALDTAPQEFKLTGHGLQDWPHGTVCFKRIIPAGFKSKWVTVAP
jgi:hypothetical protein